MSRRFLIVAALGATLGAAGTATAQTSHPVLGTWTIEYERGRRVTDGEATPIMGTGTLTISVQGDSLVATLAGVLRPDGTPAPPATMGGRLNGDAAVLTQKQTVQININGDASPREITVTWTLSAQGNELTGSMARDIPGAPIPMGPAPVKGKRVTREG